MIFDTIVAPITGSQPAAVAIVRISGPDAWMIAAAVFPNFPKEPESHKAIYGHYRTGDDGLVLPFAEHHSYTGEQSVEFSCHGSPASVRAIIEECLDAGARNARPGEFTERAFLHGRIDLTKAEAVAETVNAQTEAQLRVANRLRDGALFKEVSALRDRVLKVLGTIEATVDFEEEIGPLDVAATIREMDAIAERLEPLIKSAALGRIIRNGLRVAIIGPPNAGKSSLFNAIVGHERAIVTPVAGTTRDYLEEAIDVHGIPVVFIDTAGLRETEEVVESLGVERSRLQAEQADMTWFVYDATTKFPGSNATYIIANKSDLLNKQDWPPNNFDRQYLVSAKTGEGISKVLRAMSAVAEEAAALQVPPPNERHVGRLQVSLECIRDSKAVLVDDRPFDLLSTLLRGAANHLGEITGETASADMIERIFADFCIGK